MGRTGTVSIPFTDFTDLWDDITGELIQTCAEKGEHCPDRNTLTNMQTMSLWAEGVAGQIHLELSSVAAYGCSAAKARAERRLELMVFD